MKILSADDSAIIRKIIKGAAEVLEFELLEASDGLEALELLEKQYKDIGLILLDWNMPGLNGYDLLKEIKSNSRFRNIPVMMVTTESERQNIVKAIQAGASHYMTKPFTIEELIKKILECLGKGG
ncbi:MAG: response regulator [Clostridia bacterium]|nr:response regulator [Clostridia bacterium]